MRGECEQRALEQQLCPPENIEKQTEIWIKKGKNYFERKSAERLIQ